MRLCFQKNRFLMTRKKLFRTSSWTSLKSCCWRIYLWREDNGASNDFEQATGIVRSMITEYGMVDELGTVQYEIISIYRTWLRSNKGYSRSEWHVWNRYFSTSYHERSAWSAKILEEHKDQGRINCSKTSRIRNIERTIQVNHSSEQVKSPASIFGRWIS